MLLTYEEHQHMYLDNRYTDIYNRIISIAKSRNIFSRKEANKILGYAENHHILPRSLNGKNIKNNLVFLTPKEHFICHRLLVRMTTGREKLLMLNALNIMLRINEFQHRIHVSSRVYEYVRIQRMKFTGPDHYNYGRKQSLEWREKRSKDYCGSGNPNFGKRYKIRDTTNYNNSNEQNPMFGKKHKTESLILMSETAKNRPKLQCTNCNKIVDVSNFARWHGPNCKVK